MAHNSGKKVSPTTPRKIRHAATSLFHNGFYVAATKHNPQRCATSAEKRHTFRRFGLSATPEALKYMVCGQSLRRCGNFEGGVGKINSIDGRKYATGFVMIQSKLPQQMIVFVADQIEATADTKGQVAVGVQTNHNAQSITGKKPFMAILTTDVERLIRSWVHVKATVAECEKIPITT